MGGCTSKQNAENPSNSIINGSIPKQMIQMPKNYLKQFDDEDDSPLNKEEDENDKKTRKENKMKKKIRNISNKENNTIYENFNKVNRDLKQKDILFILTCLKSHFVFFQLSDNEL